MTTNSGQNGQTQQQQTGNNPDAKTALRQIQQVRQGNLPATSNQAGSMAAIGGRNPSILERIVGGHEARKHFAKTRAMRHTAIEAQIALDVTGVVVTDMVENGLETEQAIEETIERHCGSELAMSRAPYYAQLGSDSYMRASEQIIQATARRIQHAIEG